MAIDYKQAGVDVHAGYKAVELMKQHVKSTFNDSVVGDFGSFGGLFSLAGFKNLKEPVLVSGTDGVGTKVKYAFIMDKHDTIGIDAVAMCVNDIVCSGAQPLFFLDYIATGKVIPKKIAEIVSGIAEGCRQAGAVLIGGETAEHPGLMPEDEYDIAGFSVGIADKQQLITGQRIKEGDVLVGLASSGIHSNGFSLVRRLFGEDKQTLLQFSEELNKPLGEALLTPTKIYVKSVLELKQKFDILGISHITGGGFIENIPRILPKGIGAKIDTNAYELPPIFNMLWQKSGASKESIYNTFNMGIGMVFAINKNEVDGFIEVAKALGESAFVIGHTIKGEGVTL